MKRYAGKMLCFWIRVENCRTGPHGCSRNVCHDPGNIALLQRTLFAVSANLAIWRGAELVPIPAMTLGWAFAERGARADCTAEATGRVFDEAEMTAAPQETKEGPFHQSRIGGVRVESAFPQFAGRRADPIILIHGGCHGSWVFRNYLGFFAESGWESHALNWFNHKGSQSLSPERFIVRGIEDIKEEIGLVVSTLRVPPILVAHSMGAMAAQKYAEANEVRALVLMAPVVSSEAGVDPIGLAIEEGRVWPVPPFEIARQLFFHGLDNDQSEYFYSLLCSESPRCVYEATRFTVSVNYANIRCPILALGAEHDLLVPPGYVRALAELSGADFRFVPGRGHNLLLEPKWRATACMIRDWLADNCV
jgi:pimeloyl-ACP methyl ester carboxylesterase